MKLKTTSVTTVCIGDFEPSLIELKALSEKSVISEADRALSVVKAFLDKQISHLEFPWGELRVLKNQLLVTVFEPPYVRGSDLIAKVLLEIMPSAEISAYGINVHSFYSCSRDERNRLGWRLAPPEVWGQWANKLRGNAIDGGLSSLTMREPIAAIVGIGGYLDITIAPAEVEDSPLVMLRSNFHQAIQETVTSPDGSVIWPTSRSLLDHLQSNFDSAVDRAEQVFTGVVHA